MNETGSRGVDGWKQTGDISRDTVTHTADSISSNMNRINIARILPCETTEDILESVFDKQESFWEPIDSILNKEFSIEWFLKSQEEEDALTEKIYKKLDIDGETKLVFPQKKWKSWTPPYLWKIWEQTSRYHKETIAEHLAMVVAWISEDTNNDIRMQLVALLHDAWKKYTAWTNWKWELCFYGHEKVSAYLAANVYRQLWFTKQEAEPYVRIIHDHMLPFDRLKDESKKEEYRELYWDYVTDSLTILNKNDLWITDEDVHNPERKKQKEQLIKRGNQILLTLKTEDFQRR